MSAHSEPTIIEGMLRWSTHVDGRQQLLDLLCSAVSGCLEDNDRYFIKEAALSAICNVAATGKLVTGLPHSSIDDCPINEVHEAGTCTLLPCVVMAESRKS